ncbi:Suppressor of the cold-sensitive snRNP biogenesis mutant brr1-1 [Epicoccum nigrum]|nr:Suppressor of the cold-sensitive snRNP biogenesis mutant brr1-1 [Epicoccum nigrum]
MGKLRKADRATGSADTIWRLRVHRKFTKKTFLLFLPPRFWSCATHTRELAYQIRNEYNRFAKFLPDVRVDVFYDGTPVQTDIELLTNKETHPHIIVGAPGRVDALVRDRHLKRKIAREF